MTVLEQWSTEMTAAEHAQRIRQIELQLYIAEHGMGMPYDHQAVLTLRRLLEQARKDAANDNAAITGYDVGEGRDP